MNAIEFRHINKWYGDYQALNNINLSVAKGEILVVCGPSGSGKSTLIRTVNGLEQVSSGEVSVLPYLNEDLTGKVGSK